MPVPTPNPFQRANTWLEQYTIVPESLTPLSGYSNHVFLLTQLNSSYPQRSVLRLANFSLSADLCPLAHDFDAVLKRHVAAADLGLSPDVMAADKTQGVIWIQYAGRPKRMEQDDFPEVQALIKRLHESGLQTSGSEKADAGEQMIFLRSLLEKLRNEILSIYCDQQAEFIANQLKALIEQGQCCNYFQRPLVPVHGDLNPGNLLHDGRRWWLIDWDFAGLQIREWDLAGLIVEHGWDAKQALAFVPEAVLAEIKWFCSCFAILSWHWHLQRGSHQDVLDSQWRTMQYWITLKG